MPNKLADEKSPYLLQHAYNPVYWYPWGEDAFNKANEEDKPIFLSVGYSTCHWCHVMEKESFEDNEVAKILNDNFIAIKVDREERPDIDSIYMSFCNALTGSGGWPLTIMMTPDKKPFYAGTYFPKHSIQGHIGLVDLLNTIAKAWKEKKSELVESSLKIVDAVSSYNNKTNGEEFSEDTLHVAFNEFSESFDNTYGGFRGSPKFPSSHNFMFLLRYSQTYKDDRALEMVENTLTSMYKGGIFDHIGFGFSRYSTDAKWLVPHFEKMLYDNAMIALACIETYQLSKKEIFKEIAEKIFTYVLRTMTSPEGGFYCAEDADSEGVEGKFYVWTKEEIISAVGETDGELYCKYYDITQKGNFESTNIPNLIKTNLDDFKNAKLKTQLENITLKLYDVREKRVHPHKDDKILTSWNGLMIAALAYAGRAFENNEYIKAAIKAVQFIKNNLIRDDGRLLARYREKDAAIPGYLDDYAFLTWGLIELYEASFDIEYIDEAIKINSEMIDLFWDIELGGFFLNGKDCEELLIRPKETYDGALPSGNSVAALNMVRLSEITGNTSMHKKAQETFDFTGKSGVSNPINYALLLCAYMTNLKGIMSIVIAGDKSDPQTLSLLKTINDKYLPFSVVLLNDESTKIKKLLPSIIGKLKVNEKVTAYVCKDFSCKAPVTSQEDLIKLINK